MRKSTLFISVALTTMMLVMLFGVVSAYQSITKNPVTTVQAIPRMVSQQQPVSNQVVQPTVVPTVQTQLTAEQAAQLAAKTIGRTDLYSVESTTWNTQQAYLVTFSSGDLVYVSLEGQILEITKIQTTLISTTSNGGSPSGNGNSRNKGGGEGEHESGDD